MTDRMKSSSLMSSTTPRILGLTAFDAAFLLLAGACAFVTVRSVHAPALTEIRELIEQSKAQKSQQQQIAQAGAQLERLRAETGRLEHRLTGFTDTMFGPDDRDNYMESVAGLQQTCGVAIEEITPGPNRLAEFSWIRPVNLIVSGSYAQTSCFLHHIEHELLAAQVAGFTLSTSPNDQACRLKLQLQFHTARSCDTKDDQRGDPDAEDLK